jgi:hypothetical protein
MDAAGIQAVLFTDLATKVEKSLAVIGEAFSRFAPQRLAVAVTGGKDSTLLWRLILDASAAAGRRPPVAVHLDEGDPFAEVDDFWSVCAWSGACPWRWPATTTCLARAGWWASGSRSPGFGKKPPGAVPPGFFRGRPGL